MSEHINIIDNMTVEDMRREFLRCGWNFSVTSRKDGRLHIVVYKGKKVWGEYYSFETIAKIVKVTVLFVNRDGIDRGVI